MCVAARCGVVLVIASLASVAHAQCEPQWRPGPGANGLNGEVFVMTHWDLDGPGPENPWLIVGGAFTTAGGIPANRIAAWDGNQWHALGAGFNNVVRALRVHPITNELIAGGDFTQADGAAAFFIAKWNGTAWLPAPGGGVNNLVTGLAALPDGSIFVSGTFTVVGTTVTTSRGAIWDATGWHAVASSPAASSFAVTPTGTLYAGGNFNTATDPNIRAWNGPAPGAWSSVGGGLGGCFGGEEVSEVALLSTGEILCTGDFSSARPDCTTTRFAASWNGSSWTQMYSASLSNAGLYALAVKPGDDIYAGSGWTNIWPGAGCTAFHWNSTTSAWDQMGIYWDAPGNPFVWAMEPAPDGTIYAAGRLTTYTLNNGTSWSPIGYIMQYGAPTPLFNQNPAEVATCPGATITLTASATGPGEITYHWERNNTPLTDQPGHISGSQTTSLQISNVTNADAATYRCVATNTCGTSPSLPAQLVICVADIDDGTSTGSCDGGVTVDDLLLYIERFAAGQTNADLDDGSATGTQDGGVTIDDLLYFLARFAAGC